jgi:hypothetical protein
LNSLVPVDTPFYLLTASFIDDRGQIAAFGQLPNGDIHAVLLRDTSLSSERVDWVDHRNRSKQLLAHDACRFRHLGWVTRAASG